MTDARKALAAKMAFQLKHYSDARLTPTEAEFVIAALRSPLPGTREEVARASAGTQDREASDEMVLAGAQILLDACSSEKGHLHPWKPFDMAQTARKVFGAMIAALPPAPMPEREGMREPVAWRWKPLGGSWRYAASDAEFPDGASTLQPLFSAIADSSGPNPGAIGASKEAGATTDIATVAPASTVSHDKTEG